MRPPPISTRIPPDLLSQIDRLAAALGVPRATLVVAGLRTVLAQATGATPPEMPAPKPETTTEAA